MVAKATGGGDDVVVSLRVSAATGEVSAGKTLDPTTTNKIGMAAATWMAVTDPYPTVGP